MSDVMLAGVTADEAVVPFRDLPLYELSEQALADASTVVAAIVELRERLRLGLLGSDARYDVGSDLYDLSSKVQSFALGVFNA